MSARLSGLLLVAAVALAAPVCPAAAQVSAFLERGPDVGRTPKDFTLTSVTRDSLAEPGRFSLSGARGSVVVLAFFPKTFMSGSDAQFAAFRDRYAELFGEGVTVVAIAKDEPVLLARYAAVLQAPFAFASDRDQTVARSFGLLVKGDSLARRAVYVIGRDGAVAYRDLRFDPSASRSMTSLRAAVVAARR